jgi:hypothetical protein
MAIDKANPNLQAVKKAAIKKAKALNKQLANPALALQKNPTPSVHVERNREVPKRSSKEYEGALVLV